MDAILDAILKLMKMYEYRLKFHYYEIIIIPRELINNILTLGVAEPLFEPTIVSLLTHICGTWPQWVNRELYQ